MNSLIRNFIARVNSLVVTPSVAVTAATPVLGRWGIQYDEKVIDRKIIQANEDHCGCCVVAENPKNEREEAVKNSSVVRYEKTEEYLLPYVM